MANSPALPLVSIVFLVLMAITGLGFTSVGFLRLRAARRQGLQTRWYKQTSLLFGIAWTLLVLTFFLLASAGSALIPINGAPLVLLYLVGFLLSIFCLLLAIMYGIQLWQSQKTR